MITNLCKNSKIAPNYTLNHQHVALFGQLLKNVEPILHKDFSYRNVYVKHSSHILLVYLWCLQSALFSLCGNSKQYSGFCWCFLELMLHSWMTGACSIASVCMTTFKSTNLLKEQMCCNAFQAILKFRRCFCSPKSNV